MLRVSITAGMFIDSLELRGNTESLDRYRINASLLAL